MKQPPIKTKELSGNTVQIADGQNWEIASITAYGETPQGGTEEAPVALTGISSITVNDDVTELPIPRPLRRVGDVKDTCRTMVKSIYDKRIVLDGTEAWAKRTNVSIVGGSAFYPNNFIADALINAPVAVSKYFVGRAGLTTALWEARQVGSYVGVQFNAPFTEVSDFTAWLAAHPLTVYYQSTAYDGTNGLDVMESTYNVGYIESYAGESITTAWISSTGALTTGAEVAYVLASAETYATDPVDFDNAAGPLTVMTGGEVEVALTHRMLTPYTAWAIRYDSEGEYTGDFFNVEDYGRIKQNIEYLREYAYFLYGGFTMRGMVAVTVESYGYASTIDALDANLEAIAANTFRPPDMLPVKQWRGNQPPPGPDDWNRIENTCLLLFEQFERQFACLPKLAFELKGSAF